MSDLQAMRLQAMSDFLRDNFWPDLPEDKLQRIAALLNERLDMIDGDDRPFDLQMLADAEEAGHEVAAIIREP